MFRLRVQNSFSSAHVLRNYDGKCAKLHGHNWKVEVIIAKNTVDDIGISIDFKKAKDMLKESLDYLDHCYLNDMDEFKDLNPTAENISRYIYNTLSPKFDELGGKLEKVIIWETDNNRLEYSEN